MPGKQDVMTTPELTDGDGDGPVLPPTAQEDAQDAFAHQGILELAPLPGKPERG